MKTIQCPVCNCKTFNGDYDHQFLIEDGNITCTNR